MEVAELCLRQLLIYIYLAVTYVTIDCSRLGCPLPLRSRDGPQVGGGPVSGRPRPLTESDIPQRRERTGAEPRRQSPAGPRARRRTAVTFCRLSESQDGAAILPPSAAAAAGRSGESAGLSPEQSGDAGASVELLK